MRHIWSIICKSTSIDNETNNISLFNCLEQLNIAKFKTEGNNSIAIVFEVVSLWKDEKNKEVSGNILLTLLDPKNKKIKDFKFDFKKPKGTKRVRTKIKVNGLPFTVIGDYIFRIKFKKEKKKEYKTVSELPLEIRYL